MPCPKCGLPHSATMTCHNARVLARQDTYSREEIEPVTKNHRTVTETPALSVTETKRVTEKKPGRPKKPAALSAAEKQKAYRERQRKGKVSES